MNRCTRNLLFTVLILAGQVVNCSDQNHEPNQTILKSDAVHQLLEIMRLVRDRNPDPAGWNEQLARLDKLQRQALLDSLSTRNRQDSELTAMIDDLLDSEAYQLYYRKFGNVRPEDHKQMLLGLPFGSLPSPADIAANLYEIYLHQDSVAAWIETALDRINLDSIKQRALAWLPEGDYQIPRTHFIMDGNGDAFAAEGQVVFDLYSLVLSELPRSTRYADLANSSVEQIEVVLAHEYHHVFADPIYDAATNKSDKAATLWRQRLIRMMVSEGIAMHCNRPEGLRRATKEDTTIVAFWFRELSQTLKQLEKDEFNSNDIRQWYRNSFHSTAHQLLREYLARTFEGEELNRQTGLLAYARPTLVYTLGWWMVSRISQQGTDHAAVIALLEDPYTLFASYNAVAADAPDSLRAPQ